MLEDKEYVNTQLTNAFKVSFNGNALKNSLWVKEQTHIRKVPCHTAALAALVPQRGSFTGSEAM